MSMQIVEKSGEGLSRVFGVTVPASELATRLDARIAEVAPQMNVIQIGFPLKVGVGFLFMTLTLTALSHFVGDYIIELGPMFTAVMHRAPGR